MSLAKIAALADKMDRIASSRFRYEVSTAMAIEAQKQYQAGFQRQADPYGRGWAPSFSVLSERYNRNKRWGQKTLVQTGYLRASGEPSIVTENGFRLRIYAPYGIYHQFGTRNMPQRMIIPDARMGLGMWFDPILRVASKTARAFLK